MRVVNKEQFALDIKLVFKKIPTRTKKKNEAGKSKS